MTARADDDVQAWLRSRPSLGELKEAFPAEWERVERELDAVVDTGDLEALKAYATRVATRASGGAGAAGGNRAQRRAAGRAGGGGGGSVEEEVRRQMAAAAIKQFSVAAATGVTSGRVRLGLLNGWVMQRLLFAGGGFERRRPVPLRSFRLLWPLLWQRRRLMPLVAPKGIYCFYSGALVERLVALADGRPAVEIAAGDGTLARFLRAAGADVVATDDHSWSAVSFTSDVVREDARTALATRSPSVVFCSWPPAGNPFERDVFTTPSVDLYVVVASRGRFASGDWAAYEAQTAFDMEVADDLGALVLPPELEATVLLFRRR